MSKILHLDVSPRGDRSVSRTLANEFVAALPGVTVTYRDIGRNPAPFITEAWVAGAFNPPDRHEPEWKAAIAVSDALVDELLAAEKIVISTPMYNLSVPAALKAWIDQIVRVGRTFAYGATGPQPLVTGKKLTVIITGGGAIAGTPYDFEEPYLRAAFGFIGITDVNFVRVEGLNGPEEGKAKALATGRAQLTELAKHW